MATWFTADTHFGHVRIIELSRRPFDDVRAMDEALVQNWNERVAPDDTIWHVGDFAFGRDDARIDALFGRLNGTKHLVIGNHDVDNEAILTLPLASVSDIASTLVDTQHVTMCHYPMRTWPKARKGAMHCQSAWNVDPRSAPNIDPSLARMMGSACLGGAGRGCADGARAVPELAISRDV